MYRKIRRNIASTSLLVVFITGFSYLLISCSGSNEMTRLHGRAGTLNNKIVTLQDEIIKLQNEITVLNEDIRRVGRKRYSMLFVGDILLANEAELFIIKHGKNYPFEKIKDDLEDYDTVFGNLETPISKRGKAVNNKPYVFEVSPKIASFLKKIKLDVVSISNNHIMDYGVKAMEDTMETLDDWDILYTGAGKNLKAARKPCIITHGQTKVYILAYCGRPPKDFYARKKKPGTAPLLFSYIQEDIKKHKRKDTVVLVSLHWGIEQTRVPSTYQRNMAKRIITAGADGIIGHHPHWPQGIEIYKGKPIIYSLGNFINGHYNKTEMNNIVAAFHYYGPKIEQVEIMCIAGKNRRVQFQPYIFKGKEAKGNLEYIQRLSQKFGTKIKIEGYKGVIKL